jgi:orotate phosphoribosyltransferase
MPLSGNKCWLTSEQKETTIDLLIGAGLIHWSSANDLPLSNGKLTDIYVNLRQMRNYPNTMRELAKLYEWPLSLLKLDKFVEVPDAVSPMAGIISVNCNIPLVTIRNQEKANRVVTGKVIGELQQGERIAIIDDVITDGTTKLHALKVLCEARVHIAGIIVLVDRRQKRGSVFKNAGYSYVEIFAGMVLSDIRESLIRRGILTPSLEK